MKDRSEAQVERAYQDAKERYSAYGIDTDEVLSRLSGVEVSMNCWQGDDVAGFEGADSITGGGILATGNYPGRARNVAELRQDAELAFSLIPGKQRFNLHAIYLDSQKAVDRDEIAPEHFASWIDWAKKLGIGLDFNPTFFSHDKAAEGYTLASYDGDIRRFWIEHGKRCREIAADMGRKLGSSCVNNLWIPDGSKDDTTDRLRRRELLVESLDEVFAAKFPAEETLDAVESKLFGIGSESFVAGSHEFYLAYALTRKLVLTMDAGHYHPTEGIAEKLSALLPFMDKVLLHVSRPVRWDSDHVVLFDDATRAVGREIIRADALDRVILAVDFFDASINRIIAWVVGLRSTTKSLLAAMLEPNAMIREAEEAGRLGERLALLEDARTMPISAVWDKFCLEQGTPLGGEWLDAVRRYETEVLLKRS
ncbi:MAG: L-rhamnose isomerase [Spirochaetaceae bacterium]|nr:MAG: L-rhamnose isomerase [Spirochaetaceae bacterium]